MARKPPEVVGQVFAIPLAHIEVGARLRPIDPVWADALGKIMAVEGQKTPIEVAPVPGDHGFILVAGGHRLEGARLQGWRTIKAVIVDADALERREREISENLWRKGLDPIDRAAFVAELHDVLRAKAGVSPETTPQQLSVQARWQKQLKEQAVDTNDTMSFVYGFTAEASERIGLGVRTIQRDLELHRGILPSLLPRLRRLPIARNAAQLRALARMPEADQRAVVDILVEGKAKGATDALGLLRQKPAADPAKKAWSAFFGGWSRMNARQRREALRELADLGLPPGVRIVIDEAGDE